MKILMVCLGNICRSPLAEGILKNKLLERGLDWTVDSAGTGFWHIGEPPDPRSVSTAKKYGLDISRQRARQIRPADLKEYDLILAMDSSNYQDILRLADNGQQKSKVEMILNYVDPGSNRNVPDPYWNDDGFDQVFRMLEEACDKVIEKHL
ncbi:MAG: low molecular weight phosphotyrosine protein phosphatase [Lewinellaceae bacterium]|nr:low molecular weight phosphotyrosine protein phosphatase [Phaeodactylibacter sp.]MCB9037621.1 low molecular weight phosphotyrosine protein phosphatase [Lewinellaceae bacterium]